MLSPNKLKYIRNAPKSLRFNQQERGEILEERIYRHESQTGERIKVIFSNYNKMYAFEDTENYDKGEVIKKVSVNESKKTITDLYSSFDWQYNKSIYRSVVNNETLFYLIMVAYFLGLILAIITIGMETYTRIIYNKGPLIRIVVRVIIFLLILSNFGMIYTNTISLFDSLITGIIEGAIGIKLDGGFFVSEHSVVSSYSNNIDKVKDNNRFIKNSASSIIVTFLTYFAKVIIFVLLFTRNIILTILMFFGPLVFVTMLNADTDDYVKGYLRSFFNVLLWPLIIGFLVFLMGSSKALILSGEGLKIKYLMTVSTSVFIVLLLKVTKFIPNLEQGKGGSMSVFQTSLAAVASTAAIAKETTVAAGTTVAPGLKTSTSARDTVQDGAAKIGEKVRDTVNNIDQDVSS